MPDWKIIEGACRDVLRTMPAQSVQRDPTGAPCGCCGHGEGFHRYGKVGREYRYQTPCQHRGCDCAAYVLAEYINRPRDYSHVRATHWKGGDAA